MTNTFPSIDDPYLLSPDNMEAYNLLYGVFDMYTQRNIALNFIKDVGLEEKFTEMIKERYGSQLALFRSDIKLE